jgi:hypothetical protein
MIEGKTDTWGKSHVSVSFMVIFILFVHRKAIVAAYGVNSNDCIKNRNCVKKKKMSEKC